MKKILILFFIFTIYLLNAQFEPEISWTRIFDGGGYDCGYSVKQTPDGGYLIIGEKEFPVPGYDDVWLIKTDSDGNELWNQTYGDSLHEEGWEVILSNDGGYVIIGHTDDFGAGLSDIWMLKTDSNGDTLWTNTFGGWAQDKAYAGILTEDENYLLLGHTYSYGSGSSDVWLVKIDSEGNEIWNRTFGGTEDDKGWDIKQTDDGGYIIVGYKGDNLSDVWLMKTDSEGNEIWNRTFGYPHYDGGYSVNTTVDNGYLISGFSYNSNNNDLWLIKTDSEGNEIWNQTYGDENLNDSGWSIVQNFNDDIIITGHNANQAWFMQTDSEGIMIWDRTLEFDSGRGYSVILTEDGGCAATGIVDNDLFLVKFENLFHADFSSDVTFGDVPLELDFINQSVGIFNSWHWDFNNDGITDSYLQNPTHFFPETGYFTVSLTVSDGINEVTETKEDYISVYNPLNADFVANVHSGDYPLEVEFIDLSTGNILFWHWDFDDDGINDSEQQNPTHIYEEDGIYDVRLLIFDDMHSVVEVKENYITVTNPVNADFVADVTSGDYPLVVGFTDLSTGNNIEWYWDFEYDGSYDSFDQNPTHTYSNAGVYTVSLIIQDDVNGDIEIKENYITVNIPALNANFIADLTSGDNPLEVNFTNTSTGEIVGYMWDFENDGIIDSNEENPSYIYNNSGVFTVSLLVTDGIDEDEEIKFDYIVVNSTDSNDLIIPNKTQLYSNYPNPFNPLTTICFDICSNDSGTLSIYNQKGQIIECEKYSSGRHIFEWDSSRYSSGIYFYKLKVNNVAIDIKKMLLLK